MGEQEKNFCEALRHTLAEFEVKQYQILGPNQFTGELTPALLSAGFHPIERKPSGGFDLKYTQLDYFHPDNQGIFQAYIFDLRAREQIVLEASAKRDDLQESAAQEGFKKLVNDLKKYAGNSALAMDDPSVVALGRALAVLLGGAQQEQSSTPIKSPRK